MQNSISEKTYALFENPGWNKMVSNLENAGAKIIRFPTMETEKVRLNEVSTKIINNLKSFDWIIFPDVLTVDFFLQILEENAIDFFELDEIRVCAGGEVVSDQLRFVQLHADVIPQTIEPKEIISALRTYIGVDEFHSLKFLWLKEFAYQNELEEELTGKVQISELSVYQIKTPPVNDITKLKTLLKGGAIDEFIFSVPTDFIWLNFLFKGEPLDRLLAEIRVSGVDGSIFQTAREHNLKQVVLFQRTKIDTVNE